jgi:GTPase SAR1 family protein
MIRKGVESIPVDNTSESAILVIGDTGVGKSTIMSFLSGA